MAAKERFRRRERTVEDIRRKASEGSRDYDNLFKGDVKLFKPAEGENIIRIMPATWGLQPYSDAQLDKMSDEELAVLTGEEDRWGNGWDLPIWVHYGVGPDNASYLCRDKMLGEPCAVCEAKAATRDPDEADALAPTKRGLCYMIDRNAEKEGPQIWSMPFSKIRNEIYSRSVDKKHGTPILVDDPEEGFDVIFNRAGKDARTNYTGVEIDRDAVPLHDDEKRQDLWLDYTMEHPLQGLLNFYDHEHIEKVLFGRASAKRDADASGEETAPRGDRSERRSVRDRTRSARGGESEERDYRDEPGAGDAPEETAAPRGRRGAPAADPPEETGRRGARAPAAEETGEAPTERRSRRSREAPVVDPDPEVDGASAGGEETPADQARGQLRSLRSRSRR